MENSTKAIIIGGSILIALLLISTGIVIFNSTKSTRETAEKGYNNTAVQTHNQKYKKYEGTKKGAEVKDLISTIMSSDDDVSIWYGTYGMVYFEPDKNINQKNKLMELNKKIKVNENYYISMQGNDCYDGDGYIKKIYVYSDGSRDRESTTYDINTGGALWIMQQIF